MYKYCYRGHKPSIDGMFKDHQLQQIAHNCKNIKQYLDYLDIKTGCEMCEGGHFYYLKTNKPLPERVVRDMQFLEIWDTELVSDNVE
jgi:surfactin synthase thioesterase subunit